MAWELQVKRLGLQKSGKKVRTYGTYQVVINRKVDASLSGHICERPGPGDNTLKGRKNRVRIAAGRYALSTQFGRRYRSVNFSADESHPPAFLVLGTGKRTGILVHPAHHPKLYLSSIGCFNPSKPLKAADNMVFKESRARVIAILNSLKNHDPDAFAKVGKKTPIKEAFIVVEGEPTAPVPDDAVA
jgi:hypothetical protein